MIRKISFFIITLLILISSSHSYADEAIFDRVMKDKTIRCGYFVWPPYVTKNPNTGAFSGINYEIMEVIGKNLGLKIEWAAEIGAGDVVEALKTEKVDVMCAALWPIPARTQELTLSLPTFFNYLHAFARTGDIRFDSDLDKANRKEIKVAVIEGDATQNLAMERLPHATLVALPQTASGAELLLQVITEKADIALVEQALANDFLKSNPGTLRRIENIPPGRVFGEHLALKRGEYQLKNMFDIAITQLTNDGIIEEITKRYSKDYKTEFLAPTKTFQPVDGK